ncbi:hypothetical protein [Moraxella lacunata]|uniref:hypothetical protein n=1 Tax=Moraxella lacunata TaxID=477 RepID=UPI0024A7A2E2|nr:hypothetical protein [Moraxella lacunata]
MAWAGSVAAWAGSVAAVVRAMAWLSFFSENVFMMCALCWVSVNVLVSVVYLCLMMT